MQAAARQCVRRLLSATAGAGPSSLQASAGAASLAGFGAWSRAGAGNGAAEALAGMRFDGGQLFRGFASPVHTVDVQQNNVDRAFKKLRRKMIDSGLFKELKERVYHQKPSQLRVRLQSFPNDACGCTRHACSVRLGICAVER